MNEKEKLIQKKIEKREKFDVLLSYILIIILLGAIITVLYLKFWDTDKHETYAYPVNNMTLGDLVSTLNTSELKEKYASDDASFNTTVDGNTINISYTKEDIKVEQTFPLVGTELEITIPEENKSIIEDIYKEIAYITCVFYNEDNDRCRNATKNITTSVEGIRFDTLNNKVYIDINKKLDIEAALLAESQLPKEVILTKEDKIEINEETSKLEDNDVELTDIKANITENNITFTGKVTAKNDEEAFSVVIKLYGEEDKLLKEEKQELKEVKANAVGDFTVDFDLEDSSEKIKKYSIEIIK